SFSDTVLRHLSKIRNQIEFQSLAGSFQSYASDAQCDQNHKKQAHHGFVDALHAVSKSHAADTEAHYDSYNHPEGHFAGICQHIIEDSAYLVRSKIRKGSGSHLDDISQHPAADGSV